MQEKSDLSAIGNPQRENKLEVFLAHFAISIAEESKEAPSQM